jgi:hypothetical protein
MSTTETIDEARDYITRDLKLARVGEVVRVDDGQCAWIAEAEVWDAAVEATAEARVARMARRAADGRYDDVSDYSQACQACDLLVGAGGVTRHQLAEQLAVMDARDCEAHGLDEAERDGALQALLGWGVDTRDLVAGWARAGEAEASLAEDQGRAVEPGEEPALDVLAAVPGPLRDAAREAWQRGWDDYADLLAADAEEVRS